MRPLSTHVHSIRLVLHASWAVAVILYIGLSAVDGFVAHMQAVRAMAEAAGTFIGALTEAQRAVAVLPFEDPRRLDWHFIHG